jgi:hypothetical protein
MKQDLLARIERFMLDSGQKASTFGRVAIRDPKLVAELRQGRVLRPPTEAKVDAHLRGRGF